MASASSRIPIRLHQPFLRVTVHPDQQVANLVGHDVSEPARDRRLLRHCEPLDAVVKDVSHPATGLRRTADRSTHDAIAQALGVAFLVGHVARNDHDVDIDRL